jgi:hypothetical protein
MDNPADVPANPERKITSNTAENDAAHRSRCHRRKKAGIFPADQS